MKSNPFKSEKYSKKYYIKEQKIKKNKKYLSAFKKRFNKSGTFKKDKINDSFYTSGVKKEKAVYIDTYVKNKRPVWIIPALSVLLIILLVFWIGPVFVNTLEEIFFKPEENTPGSMLLYDSPVYSVVLEQFADVYESPDIRSKKITQALYNEIVEILDADTFGFYKVRLQDGFEGYILHDKVTGYTRTAEPSLFSHKLVVTARSKRIMSHSSSGSLVMEAVMGTVLFSDFQGSNIYRVALPDGNFGWVSSSGIIRLDPLEKIQESSLKNFYETALSFNNTTFFEGGMTKYGTSMEGLLYISAFVNGIVLPRNLQLQADFGKSVELAYDDETGFVLYNNFKNGDLVFFGKNENDSILYTGVGIVAGYGQVLTVSRASSSIRIVRLDENMSLKNSIVSVKRLFDD